MDDPIFTKKDIDHLNYALKLFPELEFATFAACYANEQKLKFPVTDLDQLKVLFKDFKKLPKRIQNWGGTMQTVKEYFPEKLLPIKDTEDFLDKVLLTMLAGNQKHLDDDYYEE